MFHGCTSLTFLDDISKWNTDNVNDINMIFSNCPLLSPFPDLSNWKCNNNKDILKNDEEEKIIVKGKIVNDNLKFLPQIELKFSNIDKYEANLIHKLRNEIKTILKTDNFSIVQIRKGSLTVILALQCILINELKKWTIMLIFLNLFLLILTLK